MPEHKARTKRSTPSVRTSARHVVPRRHAFHDHDQLSPVIVCARAACAGHPTGSSQTTQLPSPRTRHEGPLSRRVLLLAPLAPLLAAPACAAAPGRRGAEGPSVEDKRWPGQKATPRRGLSCRRSSRTGPGGSGAAKKDSKKARQQLGDVKKKNAKEQQRAAKADRQGQGGRQDRAHQGGRGAARRVRSQEQELLPADAPSRRRSRYGRACSGARRELGRVAPPQSWRTR